MQGEITELLEDILKQYKL
jgi:hypothetical protein